MVSGTRVNDMQVGSYLMATFEVTNIKDWDNGRTLRLLIRQVAHCLNTSVRQITTEPFAPVGHTVIAIIAESHISIHTFPEKNLLTLDVFCCNQEKQLSKAVECVASCLPVKYKKWHILQR